MSNNLVSASIDGKDFRFWDSIKLNQNIATFDTFAFGAPYDPDNSLLKNSFIPLSYKPIEIKVNDELFLTGNILPVDPELSDSNSVAVSGYAKAGILNDCSIVFDEKRKGEYNDQTLEQIAREITGFFNLQAIFTEPSGAIFESVALETGKKPLDFLIELAKQRGFLITNNQDGNLSFQKALSVGESTTLRQGSTPLQSVTPEINPQDFYSSITGLAPAFLGFPAESVTVVNPFLNPTISGQNRPFVYKADQELSGADLQKAVKWKMGLMFANAIKYKVSVSTWRDEREILWRPNTFINLTAPNVMINKETTFLIENVNLDKGDGETAELSLVLPESYRGEIPKTLPWLE